MIIKNASLRNKKGTWDLEIVDGKIERIGKNLDSEAKEALDIKGSLVLPPFIEPHIHLDSALTAGEPEWNNSGTLLEGIQRWSQRKRSLSAEDVKSRAKKALQWQLAQGIQYIRTHIDVTDPKLTALKAMLEVKEEMAPYIDLQIVAFPQEGILSFSGGQELLEESLRLGADVVGGIPHYELTREDGVESVKIVFELAQKYDRLVDIHCDETDDGHSRFIETVAAQAYRTGMGSRVTASHTTAMHSYNDAYANKLFRLLKLADINFIANPLVNIHLQGRFDSYPKRRGITRVKELLAANLNVCFGQDDILDPWYPLGTGNMLQVLHMGIHICQLLGYEEIVNSIDLITSNSARTLNVQNVYGVEEGKSANFIVIDAADEYDMIRRQPAILYSVRNGRIISKTKPSEMHVDAGSGFKEVDLKK
ncbi:cytosine deaminase [Peribacillus glennii]|uniref:Cytosine deaminase n=1 Tax=Peribacillus glennii TaxID=2303991 RepID=A0A372LGQ0_9BACI|nr:cytosine deaminase [Peribacillus glennii]RFU65164.1 cytosine deaminase [Peribacillus glennii]